MEALDGRSHGVNAQAAAVSARRMRTTASVSPAVISVSFHRHLFATRERRARHERQRHGMQCRRRHHRAVQRHSDRRHAHNCSLLICQISETFGLIHAPAGAWLCRAWSRFPLTSDNQVPLHGALLRFFPPRGANYGHRSRNTRHDRRHTCFLTATCACFSLRKNIFFGRLGYSHEY